MSETDPERFLDDLRELIRANPHSATARLVLNRPAIVLFLDAMKELDPAGFYQLPAVVMFGQRGQVGFLDGCAVFYDPSQDTSDGQPVARFVVEDE